MPFDEIDLDQALAELMDVSDIGNITGQMQANIGKTRASLAEAVAERDKPESKFNRYADPIERVMQSIAFIADISSKRPGRRRGAREKYGTALAGIEQGKVQRKGKRKSAFDEALQQMGIEQGLDQGGLKILQAEHQADVAAAEAKVGVAEMKYKQGKIDTRADKPPASKPPTDEERELAASLKLWNEMNNPQQFAREHAAQYSSLVAARKITPIGEKKDERGGKALDMFLKWTIDNPDAEPEMAAEVLEKLMDAIDIFDERSSEPQDFNQNYFDFYKSGLQTGP